MHGGLVFVRCSVNLCKSRENRAFLLLCARLSLPTEVLRRFVWIKCKWRFILRALYQWWCSPLSRSALAARFGRPRSGGGALRRLRMCGLVAAALLWGSPVRQWGCLRCPLMRCVGCTFCSGTCGGMLRRTGYRTLLLDDYSPLHSNLAALWQNQNVTKTHQKLTF